MSYGGRSTCCDQGWLMRVLFSTMAKVSAIFQDSSNSTFIWPRASETMSIFSQATGMAAQISLVSLWHLWRQASHFLQLSVESIWRIHNETGTFDGIKLGCSVALNRHHCSQHLDPSTRGTSLLSSTALLLHRAPFSTTEKAMRTILRSWLSISWSLTSASCSPHRMRGSEILELHRWLARHLGFDGANRLLWVFIALRNYSISIVNWYEQQSAAPSNPQHSSIDRLKATIIAFDCGIFTMVPRFPNPAFRAMRSVSFASLGLSAFIPVVHGIIVHG